MHRRSGVHPRRGPAALRARPSPAPSARAGVLVFLLAAFAAAPASAQDEFLVNDDRIDRNQWVPRVALGASGSIVAAWMDGRNGGEVADYDIYSMTLRDPLALGASLNRRVNDGAAGPDQGAPDIAASPAGTFLCVWEDTRGGSIDVFAAALDSLGTSITPSLRVNDDATASDQLTPCAAAVGADRYLVAWGDGRQGQGEIFVSWRTATGAALGANRKISVDPVAGGSFQGEPALAADASGRTLVAWLDGREGGSTIGATYDVYGQWLDAAGDPVGGNFKINDTTGPQRCASVTAATDGSGRFLVAWIDRRGSPGDPGDVYAQRYDAFAAAAEPNVKVNDDPPGRDQRSVRAAGGRPRALVVWEDLRGSLGIDPNVMASFVPFAAGAPTANVRVNQETGARQGEPSAVWDGRDAYLVLWEDNRNGPSDVFAISLLESGARRGAESRLNDDAAPNDQWRPRLGHGRGRYLATWFDRRRLTNDLFGQWVTSSGAREGVNHLLWPDDQIERPVAAASAALPSAALVAAQIARFSDAGDIRGFWFDQPGAPPARAFWIGDELPSAQASPAAAASDSGFAVLWIDSREGTPRVYGQRVSAAGDLLGPNHAVLASDPADPVYALDVEADPGGGWWAVLAEGSSADQRLWLVRLSEDLHATSPMIAVAPEIAGPRSTPSIGVGSDGRVEVAWLGEGAGGLARVHHASFAPGGSFRALAMPGGAVLGPQAAPSLAVSGGGSILVWEERAQGNWSLWITRFAGGSPTGEAPGRVDQDLTLSDQLDPCAGLDDAGHAVVIWTDGRSTSSGTDILGRAFSFTPTSADDPPPAPDPPGAPEPAPRVTRVLPVRPNPFSSAAEARLEVAEGTRWIRAAVWSARGERVAVLHDGAPPSGRFSVRWDGRGADGRPAASGLYWITVESERERHAARVVRLR